jgi:hypothetical protein
VIVQVRFLDEGSNFASTVPVPLLSLGGTSDEDFKAVEYEAIPPETCARVSAAAFFLYVKFGALFRLSFEVSM